MTFFPTRENCNPDNPEEAFLWMFVALPHVKGAPLMMPVEFYRLVSKRLWELGARPVEEPTLQWVPPMATDPNFMSSPGRWVPAGTGPVPSEEDEAASKVALLSNVQKAEVRAVLQRWMDGHPLPDSPAGRAVNELTEHQRDVVWKLLR